MEQNKKIGKTDGNGLQAAHIIVIIDVILPISHTAPMHMIQIRRNFTWSDSSDLIL